ncbi:MAG: MerR family transcriptional regulator [Anaerolineaceae bacterium]|nr:MerR family transcriptional regulator [Anaerolineaceae bacterium]
MMKIGDFARIGQVSVVTLRHYDDYDLLKPVRIDTSTGYRYYSVSQLPRLNRILALKDLGFSLEQIKLVLNEPLTLDQLRGMLIIKQAQLQQHVAEEQARLKRITARLRQIELENSMSQYDVVVKTVPATMVVSRRFTVPTNEEVPDYLGPAYQEVWGHVKTQKGTVSGTNFTIWHQSPEVVTNEVVEAVVPISNTIPGTDRIDVYELPETLVASAVHDGDFNEFTQAHFAILSWMEANGYEPVGGYREIYIKHNADDYSDSTTEVQFPVKKSDQ